MKQILFQQGKAKFSVVPDVVVSNGRILVEVTHSFISAGTEMSTVSNESGNFWIRALKQPQAVFAALKMVKERGIQKTWMMVEGVRNQEKPMGYSCAGRVLTVGNGVNDIFVGDRVACGGAADAHHAELVSVPRNLVVKVPEGLSLEQASCATIGSIAMQGFRRADVRLGDRVAVIGLGLLGQLTLQLLRASGCHVLGSDPDEKRRERAKLFGAEMVINPAEQNAVNRARDFGNGHGVDATIITAASKLPGIIQQTMEMTRRKGRVILVGAVPIEFDRSPFYQKEIDFLISCSYGPGRYDPEYEQKGLDYPYAYVRWTENRNMQEFLELAARGSLDISGVIDKVFPAQEVEKAYNTLKSEGEKPLGVVLEFPVSQMPVSDSLSRISQTKIELATSSSAKEGKLNLAVLGAGGFAQAMHIPNALDLDKVIKLGMIVDINGVTAKNVARNYNVHVASTNADDVFASNDIDAVLITTRHNVHAELSIKALQSGKHVICEKPMGLTLEELSRVETAVQDSGKIYLVGFNRRFSPAARKIREKIINKKTPLMMLCRIAAGHLPLDHWTQGEEGGGRIIGEGCHWIDLMQYFVGDDVEVNEIDVSCAKPKNRGVWWNRDNVVITLSYADGSVGTLMYCAMASKAIPKEYIEVHWDGCSAIIDDFNKAVYYDSRKKIQTLWRSQKTDKGHLFELEQFAKACMGEGKFAIPFSSLLRTSRIVCNINSSLMGKAEISDV